MVFKLRTVSARASAKLNTAERGHLLNSQVFFLRASASSFYISSVCLNVVVKRKCAARAACRREAEAALSAR